MTRVLIVGKLIPGSEDRIAEIFADSDRSELPDITGVRHRSLYSLHDLHLHLIETAGSAPLDMARAHAHPLFVAVNERLDRYTSPYLPTWRGPRDAMAHRFYTWDAPPAGDPGPGGASAGGGDAAAAGVAPGPAERP